MHIFKAAKSTAWLPAFAAVSLCARMSLGIDFEGVRPAAIDQPQVNVLVQPAGGGDPYALDLGQGFVTFNIEAYLDTGTSGIVISEVRADLWEIPRTPGVVFSDVAIGGFTDFNVSPEVRVRVAPSSALDVDNLGTFETVYDQAYGPMRVQVGPINLAEPPLLDIVGMPVMMGKTVVIDPTVHLDDFVFLQSYIYDPGTPFNPDQVDSNPGIPTTTHHVQLSYGDFARFTLTTPEDADPPQLNHNPFIGPDPTNPADNTPPVTIGFGGAKASGSFLFDTGAFTTFLSADLAASLNVRYSDQFTPDGDPQLETFDPAHPELPGQLIANQFLLPVAGISGNQSNLPGFYLDELILHTLEGGLDDADPDNIRYLGAPVAVLAEDIVLEDPVTMETVTLDGIFGMNYLLASATPDFEEASLSPYRWVTFDEPTGTLGLAFAFVPEPSSYAMAICGLIALASYAWRRRMSRPSCRTAL